MAKLFPFSNITNLLVSFITFSNIIYNKQEHYDRLVSDPQNFGGSQSPIYLLSPLTHL